MPDVQLVTNGGRRVVFGGGDCAVEGSEDGFVGAIVHVMAVGAVAVEVVIGTIGYLRASMCHVFPGEEDITRLAEGADSGQPT